MSGRCAGERCRLARAVLQFAGVVIVWSGGVADTPTGHRVIRIDLRRFLEAPDSLFMVVAKTPVEATRCASDEAVFAGDVG